MRAHTIRRAVTAIVAAAGLAGMFVVGQPAEALPIDDYDVTIDSGSFMEVTGADGMTQTTFTMGDPACNNGEDDDMDMATDHPADDECVDAMDNSECDGGDLSFTQPSYDIHVDDADDNPAPPGNSTADNFSFPGYEMGLGTICVSVSLSEVDEPENGFYDVDHSATDQGRAWQDMEIQADFDIALTGDQCTLGPVSATVDSSDTGGAALTAPPSPQTATMTVQDVHVPAVQSTTTCGVGIANAINTQLGGMPGEADAVLNITVS